MKKLHPEQRYGELFRGNATVSEFRASAWRTKRFGQTAYDALKAA
jgi:hypothetical protein